MIKYKLLSLVLLCCWSVSQLQAQEQTECNPTEGLPITQGDINFNYGSVTNGFSFENQTSFTIGQPMVHRAVSQDYKTQTGFWSFFLIPPQMPAVSSTQGTFPDRIQVSWTPEPLGSQPTEGFKILRDGAFLTQVDGETFQFVDFNVQAGELYEYSVIGKNQFGQGVPGMSIGFVNPNGVVTGKVETFTGNPIPGAVVTLSPTIGNSLKFNGEGDYVCISHDSQLPTDMFTVSTWVKIGDSHDSDGIVDLGSDLNKNFWVHTTPASMDKGVVVGVGDGTAHEITYEFVDETPENGTDDRDDWHHIAAVYGGGSLILYVDGDFIASMQANIANEAALFTLGSRREQAGFLDGWMDDTRIYNRLLTQTEIITTKDITVSNSTEGLVAYWKFDEGLGTKAFDLSNTGIDGTLTGTSFDTDTPDIKNAGITDESGFYAIEGINYSQEQSFLAKPEKIFYDNYALEFNAAYQACATLTNFDLRDTSHIELTVHPFDLNSKQSILSKMQGGSEAFNLYLENAKFYLSINGQSQELGAATAEYQHLALSINATANEVTYYRNGTEITTLSYTNVGGTWNGEAWQLGAKGILSPVEYYTGLIDEVAFYQDSLLTTAEIQLNAAAFGAGGTDIGHGSLTSYFDLNEGTGTELADIGAAMTGTGTLKNGAFSIITLRQGQTPHDFQPDNKLININPSATAIGNIDFTDISTVPIAGVIRFENTFCFQDSVEILVNGESNIPQIFTDENGRFVADFEPGATVKLSPKYGEEDEAHLFFPGFYEARKLNRPIAGVLFQNLTKREVKGQLTGGYCENSIIPNEAIVKVKIRALNGCYEQEKQLTNADGNFTFKNLPPTPMAVSLVEHSNNVIYNYFQLQGGVETDIRLKNDSVGFTYFAPPTVELSDLKTNDCGTAMLNAAQSETVNIKVYEQYDGGRCYVDTALLTINNDIADLGQFDTLMVTGELEHKFKAGFPNLVPPHQKTIQVTATLPNGQATENAQTVVTGRRARETTFASTSPEIPTLILRDPPGDGSYAYVEEGSSTCQKWAFNSTYGENESESTKLSMGGDITTSVGIGAEVELKIEGTADIGQELSTTYNELTSNETETCVTFTEKISTGDNDLIVGSAMGGDVYMGGAINFVFGITDELIYDDINCEYVLDKGLYVFPNGFSTTFIYTENHIQNIVIPNLITIGDQESADAWQAMIDRNTDLKNAATYSRNISFDAGVVYEQAETTEVTQTLTNEWSVEFSDAFTQEYGLTVNGIGLTEGINMTMSAGISESEVNTESTSRTVGYVLADDDFFDNFAVTIKKDAAYGTPVFDLESGQSSCPNEPGTQPREEVSFSANEYVAVNVPAEDAATFTLTLGNLAPSNDVGFYTLELVHESNPHNAVVTVNGEVLNAPTNFEVLPGENVVVDFSIQRGPDNIHYDYEDIKVAYYSSCEFEHAMNLGIPRAGVNPKFYQELSFDAYFLEPCSPIGIGSPMEGWVVTPDDNEQMVITLNDYINDDPDLELLRVQYRLTDGDGAWINIAEIPKAELTNDVFHTLTWDLSLLKDGQYEIRAISQCTDLSLAPGITRVIKGRKETQPPVVFGIPQPSDGILHQGDEISITFSKRIQCDQIFAADGIGTNININNIGLYDATNGTLVDMTFACNDDKIVITPNVANQFIENRFLKVIVNDIQDLYGNGTEQIEWEFYVNRSNLIWEGGTITAGLEEGNSLTVTRKIRNQGATIADFDLVDIPDWMSASPTSGTLLPGETQLITFEFDNDLIADEYSQTVNIDASDGKEPLKVNLRVTCAGPVWEFEPSDYIYTMNMTLQLDIEGELSADEMDRVGAFITNADGDEELRGWSHVQLETSITPPGSPDGTYFAFLTIYSNEFSGEDVELKIWDVSDCILYGQVLEDFTYEADGLIGSPLEPQVVHTVNLISRTIPIHQGWNWISYNVDLPDASLNTGLASLTQPENSLIKSQTDFSVYSTGNNAFVGSLTELSHLTMYQYQSMVTDSLTLIGNPIDPTSAPIDIVAGWNWIGYLPQQGMPVEESLATLTPLNGDVVKSQIAFAQYVAGTGWIGNLNFMSSPNGYLLKISNPGTLTYPNNFDGPAITETRNSYESHWEIQPELYQYTMNMIGIVVDERNLVEDGDEVAAFVNGEIRGLGEVVYIENMESHVIFLTAYANEEGETMDFKFYDRSTDAEIDLMETVGFTANAIYGSVDAPEVWTPMGASSTLNLANDETFAVYPNPAKERVYLRFNNDVAERIVVRITDALGREVERMETQAGVGELTLEWLPQELSEGLYFITLDRAESSMTRKVRIAK